MKKIPLLLLFWFARSFSVLAQGIGGQSVEVPFAFVQNEIVLQVTLNDRGPFTMLLDTGTDPSAVDFVTARDLGLERGRPGGNSGTVRRPYLLRFARVGVGAVIATNVTAAATDLSKVSERFGMPLHGVLGHSFLNGRIVQVDYPRRVVRFYSVSPIGRSGDAQESSDYVKMAFRYDDNVLVDGIRVNGHTVTGDIDTGSDGAFKFTPKAVTDLGLDEDLRNARPTTSAGYDGVRNNFEGQLRSSVTVGTIVVESPPVVFFGKGAVSEDKPWGVNIGNGFLKDYVVTIDYKSKVIVLQRP